MTYGFSNCLRGSIIFVLSILSAGTVANAQCNSGPSLSRETIVSRVLTDQKVTEMTSTQRDFFTKNLSQINYIAGNEAKSDQVVLSYTDDKGSCTISADVAVFFYPISSGGEAPPRCMSNLSITKFAYTCR